MKGAWTIAEKDLRLLLRDKGSLFWVLAFPILMAVLFGSIFGGSGGKGIRNPIAMALVDEDQSDASRELAKKIEKSDAVKLTPFPLGEARERVRKGKSAAFLRIPQGYSKASGFFGMDPSKLEIGMDPSREVEKGLLQGILMEASFGGIQEKFRDRQWMRKELQRGIDEVEGEGDIDPVQKGILLSFMRASESFFDRVDFDKLGEEGGMKFDGPKFLSVEGSKEGQPRSPFDISFPQSLVWGFLGIVSAFSVLLVHEKQMGTMLRLRLSPLTWGEILAGKAIATYLACVAISALILTVGVLGFSVRIGGIPQLVLAIASIGVFFTGFTMFAATLSQTEQGVAGASWAIMMPMAMFGGGMVPLIAMPGWMQTASHASPVKWSVYSLEGAIWRGFSLQEMLLPSVILVVAGSAFFFLGVKLLSRKTS